MVPDQFWSSLYYRQSQGINCSAEGIEATSSNIEKIFNIIVEIADALGLKFTISTKSRSDIERFLREHQHIVEVFTALCLAQLHNEVWFYSLHGVYTRNTSEIHLNFSLYLSRYINCLKCHLSYYTWEGYSFPSVRSCVILCITTDCVILYLWILL